MPRRQKNPLRQLTAGERTELIALRRAQSAPAVEVTTRPGSQPRWIRGNNPPNDQPFERLYPTQVTH